MTSPHYPSTNSEFTSIQKVRNKQAALHIYFYNLAAKAHMFRKINPFRREIHRRLQSTTWLMIIMEIGVEMYVCRMSSLWLPLRKQKRCLRCQKIGKWTAFLWIVSPGKSGWYESRKCPFKPRQQIFIKPGQHFT